MARTIIMFDFDGTLADTMPALVDAVVLMLGKQLPANERAVREQVLTMLQQPTRQMFQEFVDLTGWSYSQVQSTVAELVSSLPTVLFPEVPAVLASLKQTGHRIVISTTTPQSVLRERVAAVGLEEQCAFVLGTSVDDGISKEDHPRLIAERLSISSKELAATAAFVGDMPSDMEVARRAGLLAIGRTDGANAKRLIAAGAQHVIADLRQLEPLLAG
jgi:phosphoglycolate phosphatase